MIYPINFKCITNGNLKANNDLKANKKFTNTLSPKMTLSGYNNPMKSYAISFGWCTSHYQVMYEIDEKYTEKIRTKLKEIENLKQQINKQQERYSIVDNASIEAAKIVAQYANLQCVLAEVPPSYAVMTGGKLKQAMQESNTLTNPISTLIAINAITNMDVKNKNLNAKQLERAKASTQLYAISILLNQVEENKHKPEFIQNKEHIDELTNIVKNSLKQIYGENIFERMIEFANMGKTPTDEQKAKALDFLVEVDSLAQEVTLPKEFIDKLQSLMNKQDLVEGRSLDADVQTSSKLTIKVQYPDHEHSVAHAHGIPHSHEHNHEHTHENIYQDILKKHHSHDHTHTHNPHIQNENEKKTLIKGE